MMAVKRSTYVFVSLLFGSSRIAGGLGVQAFALSTQAVGISRPASATTSISSAAPYSAEIIETSADPALAMSTPTAAASSADIAPIDDSTEQLPTTAEQDLSLLGLQPTIADLALHNWCTQTAGIALSSSIQICTTPRSVAGRGLFATQDVEEGEVLALIPQEVVFGVDNCREQFKLMGEKFDLGGMNAAVSEKQSGRKRRWIRKMVSKLARRENAGKESGITDESTMWAPILTRYALKAKTASHPSAEWIEQWNRCDPMHDAYLKMGPILRIAHNDNKEELPEYGMMMEELICSTATQIKNMMPHLDEKHLQAAISIRLSRLDEHFRLLGFVDDESIDLDEALKLYSLITSRAIELDSDAGVTAVLPAYDLANHSLNPNLGLEYVENDSNDNVAGIDSKGFYSIFARRHISAGEELFFRYTKLDEPMDDNSALWAAINWGIPHFENQYET